MTVTIQPTPQHWVIGNWKLNPHFAQAQQLFLDIATQAQHLTDHCNLAIAPPSPYLALFASQKKVTIAAQDVSTYAGTGAYTGEVSADILQSCGIELVIIGHSERRELCAEETSTLQQKVKNSLQAGLTIVFCVGESLAQREAQQAKQVVIAQIQALMDSIEIPQQDWTKIIIAYEPIWAIGTGKTASPQDAQDMHATIRQYLKQQTPQAEQITLLYGGSVKPENAIELSKCADINGALVGGASLDAESFIAIAQAFVK